MSKFYANMGAGSARHYCDDAKRFSYQVGDTRFSFAVHSSPENATNLTVSHFKSGCVVTRISGAGFSRPETWRDLAKHALAGTIEKYGAEKVKAVLLAAESGTES